MIKTEHFTGDYGVLLHSLANIAKKYQIEKYDIVEPEAEDWVWDLTVVFDDEKPYVYMYGSDNYDILSEEEKIPLYIAKERGWKNKKLGKPYLEEKTVIWVLIWMFGRKK